MIYVKIYCDRDENGEDMLVFDSAKEDNKYDFQVAGLKKQQGYGGYDLFIRKTQVGGVNRVAISPEAKALFLEMIGSEACTTAWPVADFYFDYYCRGERGLDEGSFSFVPLNVKQGDTSRRLRRGESFTVDDKVGEDYFDYMIPCENEMLKGLDITEPVDEHVLLDVYYRTARERGEELGCDVETIRRTPIEYLTEEQREVIRAEYRALAAGYSAQEWNETRDYDHAAMLEDTIWEAVMKKYWKFIKG